jgi:hypothetical protein
VYRDHHGAPTAHTTCVHQTAPKKQKNRAQRPHEPTRPARAPETGLTVGLLEARARAGTAVLLGLLAARVGHKQGPVIADEEVLDLLLGGLVDVCGRRGW